MASTVIRIDAKIHAKLRDWSEQQSRPIGEVVAELVERQEREQFWQQMCQAYERLQMDDSAWADYQAEVALLEGGSMDGLRDEPPYYTPKEEEEIRAHARSQGWGSLGRKL